MEYKVDERNIFLKGNKVNLVALTEAEVEYSNWFGWFNDEVVCETLQKHYFPNTKEKQMLFLKSQMENENKSLQLGIVDKSGEKLLGITSFYSIDFINRKCGFSIVMGELEGRNVSLFIEVGRLMFRHAFYTLNLRRVYGGSISKGLVSLMCRSLGCAEEGIARNDMFKNGKYHDIYLYAALKEDFKY